jgi:hypothetical protein
MAQERRVKDKEDIRLKAAAEMKLATGEAARSQEEDKLTALQNLIRKHNKSQMEREEKEISEARKKQQEKARRFQLATERAKVGAENELAKPKTQERERCDKEIMERKLEWDRTSAAAILRKDKQEISMSASVGGGSNEHEEVSKAKNQESTSIEKTAYIGNPMEAMQMSPHPTEVSRYSRVKDKGYRIQPPSVYSFVSSNFSNVLFTSHGSG